MINPNETASDEVLQQLKYSSYERFHTQFASAVEQKLIDFNMTWDDLAKLMWGPPRKFASNTGCDLKQRVRSGPISAMCMNEIAHVFSCEIYTIFRPRLPWINS